MSKEEHNNEQNQQDDGIVETEYSIEQVVVMREGMIKARNDRLGPDVFNPEETVLFSHVIALLGDIIKANMAAEDAAGEEETTTPE